MDKSDPVGKTHNNNNPHNPSTKPLTRRDHVEVSSSELYSHLLTQSKHGTKGTRHCTAASLPTPHPQVQRLEDSLAVPLKLLLPLFDKLCGFFEISYLIALAVRYSAGQRMSGSSCLFYTPSQDSKMWFAAASDLVCSLVILLQRSRWERVSRALSWLCA